MPLQTPHLLSANLLTMQTYGEEKLTKAVVVTATFWFVAGRVSITPYGHIEGKDVHDFGFRPCEGAHQRAYPLP